MVVSIVGFSGAAHGQDERPPPVSTKRQVAAVAASLVPGALIHGSGHYVLGDRRTARRLLILEGVGVGLAGAGGGILGGSGSEEHLAILYVPLLVSGVTLIAGTFLADLFGVTLGPIAEPDGGIPDRLGAGAVAGIGIGYRYVDHPDLDVGHLVTTRGAVRLHGLSLELGAEVDPAGGYREYRLLVERRLPWRPVGAHLSIGGDGAQRRLPDDRFTSTPVSLWTEMVWPLALPRLPGAYARGRLGLGLERVDYDDVASGDDDWLPFMVARAGLGMRLGWVDLELDYDHRKDGFPGGMYLGRMPGFVGSFGMTARVPLVQRFALAGAVRYGIGATGWLELQRGF